MTDVPQVVALDACPQTCLGSARMEENSLLSAFVHMEVKVE